MEKDKAVVPIRIAANILAVEKWKINRRKLRC
jgi:hypothetical protein